MKIDVIVPTNNSQEINSFISSFDKLTEFKKYCTLRIIGNGHVYYDSILGGHSVDYNLIRVDNNYYKKLVPFAALRYAAMAQSNADFFLFFDDDHRFHQDSDRFLMDCMELLELRSHISVLCTNKPKDYHYGFSIKRDGFIWTNKGLFIKNIMNQLDYGVHSCLLGAGEDLLISYMVLEKEGLPYEYYNSDITRKEKRHVDGKVIENISYSKEVMENNIIGYIKKYFDDKDWTHDSYNFINSYPNRLKKILEKRLNEQNMSRVQK